MNVDKNKTFLTKRGERTKYKDISGRFVYVKDCVKFLFWEVGTDGLQHEHYYFGRIVKRHGKLCFRYKPDGVRFSERRLDALNFDSTMDWTIYWAANAKIIK